MELRRMPQKMKQTLIRVAKKCKLLDYYRPLSMNLFFSLSCLEKNKSARCYKSKSSLNSQQETSYWHSFSLNSHYNVFSPTRSDSSLKKREILLRDRERGHDNDATDASSGHNCQIVKLSLKKRFTTLSFVNSFLF